MHFSFLQACTLVSVLLLAGFNTFAVEDLIFDNGLEEAAVITSFNASVDTIVAGESTTLGWTTENATSCKPSGGAGGWDSQAIALPDGNTPITISTAGTFTFTLTCEGTVGAPTVADFAVTVIPAVAIMNFGASPDLMTEVGSTTLSWTTENAVTCTPSGGTGGWDSLPITLPGGNTQIDIAAEGTYTFTLTCVGAAGDQVSADATVTLDVSSCPTPSLSGTVTTWKDFFSVDFPKPISGQDFATVPKTGYFALEFNTGDVIDDGKITTIETTAEDGVRLGSYSECPGDFNVALECAFIWGQSGGLRWATNGRVLACQLKPNTTYYFNVTFTDGESGSTTTCDVNSCVTILAHSNP